MAAIDCANDSDLASELSDHMRRHGLDARAEGPIVLVPDSDVEESVRSFLKDTERQGYTLRRIDPSTLLLAREVPIEYFGFLRCEMCGYVTSNEEDLLTHRRAHGIELL
ncbi:MAG: hypothetical protein KGI33_03330 [Thaumarchaeota archaeon]|nr:hypothetical protein [Nitrososphaerota archaeon]